MLIISYTNIFKILYLICCEVFTGQLEKLAKRQTALNFKKIEFFFVYVIRSHVYTSFSIIFHYRLLQDINYSSQSIHILLKPNLKNFDH